MNLAYRISWWVFRLAFATYFRWRVYNPERVPLAGPVVLAANHASILDPPAIGAALKRALNYLARDTLFSVPVLGWLLRLWEVVPVDRDGGGAAGLRAIFDRLRLGGAILLFPEGTRTPDGKLQPVRAGLGLVVIKSTAPVVPVRVFGTFEAYGRRARLPRPRRVIVKFGAPLNFEKLRAEAKVSSKQRLRDIYQEVSDEIMAAIAGLEPDDR
jgi:1-acyl-sn-glycerol-3-phosphate acyltransferase